LPVPLAVSLPESLAPSSPFRLSLRLLQFAARRQP